MSQPDPADPRYARAEAMAGLAREVTGLRRLVETLPGELATVSERGDDLARIVAQLADAVNAVPARPAPEPAATWLLAPPDPALARRLLGELCDWLDAVFLRYRDGRDALPECWLWHPEVIEELLWLFAAWVHAYQGESASVTLAGDWHDRLRPGVVRRLRGSVTSCSRENHQTRTGWSPARDDVPKIDDEDTLAAIAMWWARHRRAPAPEPPPRPVPSGSPWPGRPGSGPDSTSGPRR